MLDIRLSGIHYQVSDKVRTYAEEKLAGLARYSQRLHRAHGTIQEESRHGFRVDVDMHLDDGFDVVAHASAETVYAAIDLVMDKCAKQLRRHADRVKRSHSHAAA